MEVLFVLSRLVELNIRRGGSLKAPIFSSLMNFEDEFAFYKNFVSVPSFLPLDPSHFWNTYYLGTLGSALSMWRKLRDTNKILLTFYSPTICAFALHMFRALSNKILSDGGIIFPCA